ncbi:MAG: hypothetical protein NZ522_04995, partial [Chitinophagales bacterium]|nr:hypothetical protein [Chitinophagales bacterium]
QQDTLPPFPDYVSRNIQILRNVLTNPIVTDSVSTELGGLPGVRTEIFGNMGEEKIYYTHYSLQGKNGFCYQVCVWTRGEERKLRYRQDMERMLASFRML